MQLGVRSCPVMDPQTVNRTHGATPVSAAVTVSRREGRLRGFRQAGEAGSPTRRGDVGVHTPAPERPGLPHRPSSEAVLHTHPTQGDVLNVVSPQPHPATVRVKDISRTQRRSRPRRHAADRSPLLTELAQATTGTNRSMMTSSIPTDTTVCAWRCGWCDNAKDPCGQRNPLINRRPRDVGGRF